MKIYAFADEASPSIDEQIAAMKRNGLNGLEIRGVDGENVSVISLNKAREVRRKLEDAGLSVWSIGSPIGKIDIKNGDFDAHLDQLRSMMCSAIRWVDGSMRFPRRVMSMTGIAASSACVYGCSGWANSSFVGAYSTH